MNDNVQMKKSPQTVLGILACLCAVLTVLALLPQVSLPYRIGPAQYQRWLFAKKLENGAIMLVAATLILSAAAFSTSFFARGRARWWLSGKLLGAIASVGVFACLGLTNYVHSGPAPDAWCHANLRMIEGAKEQLAMSLNLTNAYAVTAEEISPYIKNGFAALECAEGGAYTIDLIGAEARCSFHGSMTELEVRWAGR